MMYVAMSVALVVWAGIFVYLWRLDALARSLRQQLDQQPAIATVSTPTATLERRTTSSAGISEPAGDEQEKQHPTVIEDRQ